MGKKITTEEFIEKSKNIHGNKFDYSSVEYNGSHKKIKIICPKHGIFEQLPYNFFRNNGCPLCSKDEERTNISKFIKFSNKIHNNKYDYSLVEYINNKTNVKIICPIHGIFEVTPNNHQNKKSGCPICRYENKKIKITEFIKRSKDIHNNKYDYSLVKFNITNDKIIIICPTHGIFEQTAASHLSGQACIKCKHENSRLDFNVFTKRSKEKHNNKYDYSLVKFNTTNDKIKIVCPIHGIFEQRLSSHLDGCGCKQCHLDSIENNNLTEFKKYRNIVNNLTRKNKKKLYEEWDGYDYYDGEYIKENINISSIDSNYPTIDHKISVSYGFMNNISAEDISNINNLCITKRCINSSKNYKTEEEYNIIFV